MSKPNKRRYKLEQIITREKSENPSIIIEAGDKEFEIPTPSLWPDEVYEAAATEDLARAGRLLLGDQYDDYVAAGGTTALLFVIVKDSQGMSVPESSASTDS